MTAAAAAAAAGTLSRAPGQFVSIWEAKDTYKLKVISAKNVNVAENHKVSGVRQ